MKGTCEIFTIEPDESSAIDDDWNLVDFGVEGNVEFVCFFLRAGTTSRFFGALESLLGDVASRVQFSRYDPRKRSRNGTLFTAALSSSQNSFAELDCIIYSYIPTSAIALQAESAAPTQTVPLRR